MPTLSEAGCAARRRRLLDLFGTLRVDLAVLTDVRDIYYFTGIQLPADLPAAFLLDASDNGTLVGPQEHDLGDRHQTSAYVWNDRGTRDPEIVAQMAAVLSQALPRGTARRMGIQQTALVHAVREALSDSPVLVPLDAALRELQRRKDPDEIAMVRASVQANLGAYEAVRAAIRPGITELDVLAAGYRGAMEAAGEKVFHDGDYQCGQYNGPARDRPIEAGELYIVDAWTCHRGYWSDMARTFVVGLGPSDVQRSLFDHIHWVQREIPSLLKPGADGREVFEALDEMIREHPPLADDGLIHHGGHAIGLRNHEMPDINPHRGGVLESGQVICIEPGGYFAEARFGVRLENMYLITETGCEDLCPGEVILHACG